MIWLPFPWIPRTDLPGAELRCASCLPNYLPKYMLLTANSPTQASPWNVPNLLTTIRFLLAIGVFAMIAVGWFGWALVGFIVAASTDWMDGYWARKYAQVTKLGRILDPFVDKIIVCGSFIALVEVPAAKVSAWMAIVIISRELLVTSLRGIIEGGGGDFSAQRWGKWKMVAQCVAIGLVLLSLTDAIRQPRWESLQPLLQWFNPTVLWVAILLTLYSGFDYVLLAARAMSSSESAE